jgi:16S rRNA processing protein RimM
MQLRIGRVGRAHGVRGDVLIVVQTDEPAERFAPGALLATDPPGRGPLVVEEARWHSGRLVVRFEGVNDRNAAEELRGTQLVIDTSELVPLDDPDEFHDHQLLGLRVVSTEGHEVGRIVHVLHGPAGDLLVLRREVGGETLIPFVREFVPVVDVEAGVVTITPPPGLLDL